VIRVVNAADDMSVNVRPNGPLDPGMTITVTCEIRYGGPSPISREQDPTLELTLDNEPALPAGRTHYEAPVDSASFHRKTLVIPFTYYTQL